MKKYVTTRGIEIEALTIPMMLDDKINSAHPDPEPPTYEVAALGGVVEHHPLTEQSAETPEEKALLADWQKRKAEARDARNRGFMRLVMLRGIRFDMPQDDTWIEEHKLLGVTVPEGAVERRLHYIETEVFGSVADYQEITRLVMEESGVSEEAVKQASALFRGNVERDTAEQTADSGGAMEIFNEIRAGEGGSAQPDDAKPVRRARRKR